MTAGVKHSNKYANDTTPKAGGDFSDAFVSLSGGVPNELPARYAALKHQLVPTAHAKEELVQTWREVLREVSALTAKIREQGGAMIPQVQYDSIANGSLSPEEIHRIRTVGTAIVKNAIPKEDALRWKAEIQEYAKTNKELARGFPAENPQVWEFYHTKPQMQARTHPSVLATQAFLLKQWHAAPDAEVDFGTPISYFDRLRIRWPGDAKFVIGPHIDGGSLERWEDPSYWACFSKLITRSWREHDAYDGTHRLDANMDMYHGQGACNIFRPWQGWVSMSTTRATEGTLRVFPNILLASAYLFLRPFFKPLQTSSELLDRDAYLAESNWTLDMESSRFPGSVQGHGQELSDETHPHLDLERTITSLPLVEPGDQVYWHCDVIHAVEKRNNGTGDSSVLYNPAVPLTVNNAEYLAAQREAFLSGYPPFDFSGGGSEGEARFVGRATRADIYPGGAAQRAMGFEKFEVVGGAARESLVRKANDLLFA